MDIREQVRDIVVEATNTPASMIGYDMPFSDISGWDSVCFVMILSAVEEQFDVIFPEDCIFDLTTIQAYADEIEKLK